MHESQYFNIFLYFQTQLFSYAVDVQLKIEALEFLTDITAYNYYLFIHSYMNIVL